MTQNRILNQVVANELKGIVKDLGLHHIPTINGNCNDSSAVMSVTGGVWTSRSLFSFFTETIVKTEAIYEISVNYKALRQVQLSTFLMTLNPRAVYDITVILLKHECRHIWQYQEGFYIGRKQDAFRFSLEAHGASPEEQDANDYAIKTSRSRRTRSMAIFNKATQDEDTLIHKHFGPSKEFRVAARKMIATYNPLLSGVLKFITQI
jgi:hypothetical protein